MKYFIWAAIFWACLGIPAEFAAADAKTDLKLPTVIAEYYQDRNFVAAFTTHRERVALSFNRTQDLQAPGINDERLREARLCLQRMAAREMDGDSQIAQGQSPFGRNARISGWAELQAVLNAQANTLKVQIVVYRLAPALNQRLIQWFDYRVPGRRWLPSGPSADMRVPEVSHREIHTWINTADGWQKDWLAIAQTL